MPRWRSDPQGRLERAALELFESQGFERTTVAQIAERAGLTERSFYRYYSDKREVLFAGDELAAHLVSQLASVRAQAGPLEALLLALGTADQVFRPRDHLVRRAELIAASPALAERELIKIADLGSALGRALERRGADGDQARLVVDVAMAIFRRATDRWIVEPGATLAELIARAAGEVRETVRTSESVPG